MKFSITDGWTVRSPDYQRSIQKTYWSCGWICFSICANASGNDIFRVDFPFSC